MACTKNPKRFLWSRYNGPHTEEIIMITKFMDCSTSYITTWKCINCGAERVRQFVSHEELLEQGITNDQIEIAKTRIWIKEKKIK